MVLEGEDVHDVLPLLVDVGPGDYHPEKNGGNREKYAQRIILLGGTEDEAHVKRPTGRVDVECRSNNRGLDYLVQKCLARLFNVKV